MIKSPPAELLETVGPEPSPSEPVQAAAAGNKFVLGLTPIKPKWAKDFFSDKDKKQQSSLVARSEVAHGGIDPATAEKWAQQFPDDTKVEDAKVEDTD